MMIENQQNFKVGLVQMTSNDVISENVHMAETLIREAASKGANFVLTPEMTTLLDFGTREVMEKISIEEEDTSWRHFAALAKELNIWLLIGSIAIKNGDKAANRSFLFSPEGENAPHMIKFICSMSIFRAIRLTGNQTRIKRVRKPSLRNCHGEKLAYQSVMICGFLIFIACCRKQAQPC